MQNETESNRKRKNDKSFMQNITNSYEGIYNYSNSYFVQKVYIMIEGITAHSKLASYIKYFNIKQVLSHIK